MTITETDTADVDDMVAAADALHAARDAHQASPLDRVLEQRFLAARTAFRALLGRSPEHPTNRIVNR